MVKILMMVFAVTVLALPSGSARQAGYGDQATSPMGSAAADAHNISGFWDLSIDSRQVPAASLTPAVTKAVIEQDQKADSKAIRWCNLLGMPYVMDPGRPIDIQLGTREIVVFA